MSKRKQGGRRNGGEDLAARIGEFLDGQGGRSFNYKQLCRALHLGDEEGRRQVRDLLPALVQRKVIEEISRGKYCRPGPAGMPEGVIEITSSGSAFVVSPQSKTDIFIDQQNVGTALNGDRVRVKLFEGRRGRRPEGAVAEVVKRAREEFAGTVRMRGRNALLVPDSTRMAVDIFIPAANLNGALDGQKAIARLAEWKDPRSGPTGVITEVLGYPGDNNAEAHAILVEFGLPAKFTADVERAAEAVRDEITEQDLAGRRDFRDVITFTIDPDDAKDFDDALSYRTLPGGNGNTEVGVHIADVSHYVTPGSALDREAEKRATSVYLADRVVPMLPERLSNGICSLRPGEDKLCFAAVFELDASARVVNHWIGRTVIRSARRFTYAGAQELIDGGDGKFAGEVRTLNALAEKIREKRFRDGAIAFTSIETKFRLDKKGHPVEVFIKESGASNHLIEEFMLLANKYVAEYAGKLKRGPFVYRIHDAPKPEKLEQFAEFIGRFGYRMRLGSNKELSRSFNDLMEKIKGRTEENVIEQLSIRTMEKAIYSTNNIGHYGLAFRHYSHFTSPIRRYPDILVHRLLSRYLAGEKIGGSEGLEKQCRHSSDMEKRAVSAERASVKFMQVRYMQDKVGEVFDGIISGVTEWGLYVELVASKCEGMIRLKDLGDEYYVFDERNFRVTGNRSGMQYRLGDKVRVVVKRADLVKKQLDFEMAG